MNFKPLFPNFNHRAFTLSYDDGVLQDVEFISRINKYGLKCTFNINTGLSRMKKFRSGIDCSILDFPLCLHYYAGHELATHTYSHPHLEDLSLTDQYEEFKRDIESLEKWTGQRVLGAAYPYGTYDDKTLQVLKDLGIKYARTVRSTYGFMRPFDFLLWHPTIHQGDPSLFSTLERFLADQSELPLFFLWGHTYELAINGNFDLIDKIALKLQSHEDIWYASNVEIYDYYRAVDLVVYKNNKVTNYSRRTVWCLIDNRETILLPRQSIEIQREN